MPPRGRLLRVALAALVVALFAVALGRQLEARALARRGIHLPGEPLPPGEPTGSRLGTTVELEQYTTDAELEAALDATESLGLGWLRQTLPWDRIEPAPGEYEWQRFDRVIEAAHARGFTLVLVLDRTPTWARSDEERENPLAPPADPAPLVAFARAAAERYGERVHGWQLWDEPNLMPHWGTEVIIEPSEYAALLAEVAPAIRAADPDAVIATAGLGPTVEPGGFNMSEIRFLDALYAAGAAETFDAVALKPYGFWMGPTDRLYDESILSIDRVVLAREVMQRYGDETTPIWIVEGGWAALPPEWAGAPPPWGSDGAEVQRARLLSGGKRIALEWPYVQFVGLQELQPAVGPDDPRLGLALLDPAGRPTTIGAAIAELARDVYAPDAYAAARAAWTRETLPAFRRMDLGIGLLATLLAVAAGTLGWHGAALPWLRWGARFRALPEWSQVATIAAVALAFYFTTSLVASLLLFALLGLLVGWRLDLGLAATLLTLPFFLRPKTLGTLQFAMSELLLVLCLIVWLGRRLARPGGWGARLRAALWPRDGLDWSVLALVVWGALTVPLASHFGVAAREWRVVIAGSAALYWLVRRSGLDPEQRARLVDALVVGTSAMALIALGQYLVTGDVIRAEGVRRALGLYGSPNNLALLIERVLPITLAVALLGEGRRRRGYLLATPLMAVVLFLTFSRGAWLLGMPAALLWIGWWGDGRTRRRLGALALLGLLALVPFAATERVASAADLGGGTWFIRRQLWSAALAMVRDFPLLGIGLDNFLYLYEEYRLPGAWREPDLSHPHQLFLHFWLALGLPGLGILIWQLVAYGRRWVSARRVTRDALARSLLIGFGASMAATIVHGMIDNSYFLVDLAFIWMLNLALTARYGEVTP